MPKFLVKISGSTEWTVVEAESQMALANEYKKNQIAATIKYMEADQTTEEVKMSMTENNTWSIRDHDDLQHENYNEDFFCDLYKQGVRYVCILKMGDGYELFADGSFGQEQIVPSELLDILWKEENEPTEEVKTKKKTPAPAEALVKLELLQPDQVAWITSKLEEKILPILQKDVSAYAPGRMRVWMPYEAPLDTPSSVNLPFTPGVLDDEIWQWIVGLCAKHGFKPDTCLISKGGNIKPHRDTTFAAPWAMGINLGKCDWHIASDRSSARTDYTMNLSGGEVFKFNSKHTHAVDNASADRWAINIWAIADGGAAKQKNIRGRLNKMLEDNPQVHEFIDHHKQNTKEDDMNNTPNLKNEEQVKTSTQIPKEEIMSNQTATTTTQAKQSEVTVHIPKEGNNMKVREYVYQEMEDNGSFTSYRVITNDFESLKNRQVKDNGKVLTEEEAQNHQLFHMYDEVETGGYYFPLLEKIFKNQKFWITVWPLFVHRRNLGIEPSLIFAWADNTRFYQVHSDERVSNTWLKEFEDAGLVIGNSPKMTKRLMELVKKTSIGGVQDKFRIKTYSADQLLAAMPWHESFEVIDASFDGVSLITKDLAIRMVLANKNLTRKRKGRLIGKIKNGKITNVTARLIFADGLLKGNALLVDREQLTLSLIGLGLLDDLDDAPDVVTYESNIKAELATDGSWEILTLEPHHGPGPVKTNDQTMAKYFGMSGMMEPKVLLQTFDAALNEMVNKTKAGEDIKFLDSIGESFTNRNLNQYDKLLQSMQIMAEELRSVGLGINVSQTLMHLRANGIKKQFLPIKNQHKFTGLAWKANAKEKKHFVLMPWAYRAYVMTDSVLRLGGWITTDEFTNKGFYHEETQTFVVSGKTWFEIRGRLGGADLDDEIMIHARGFKRLDGTMEKVAFLVRTPDDWSEYAIVPIDEAGPVFFAREHSIPQQIIHEFDLAKFKVKSRAGKLPSALPGGAQRPAPAQYDLECYNYGILASEAMNGGVGGQVKTKMLYQAAHNAPNPVLPCANEDMIDAIEQNKGTIEDYQVLSDWSQEATKAILEDKKNTLDAYWWHSRRLYATSHAIYGRGFESIVACPANPNKSEIADKLLIPREKMVFDAYEELSTWLNDNVAEIPFLEDVFANKADEMTFRKKVYELARKFNEGLDAREHATQLVQKLKNHDEKYGEEATDELVLKMVRASWLVKKDRKGWNYDRWLYSVPTSGTDLVLDWFIRAYQRNLNKKGIVIDNNDDNSF